MSLSRLKTTCQASIIRKPYEEPFQHEPEEKFYSSYPVFCRYQREWIEDKSPISVIEKGRQIGASWTFAFKAVYDAVADIRDTLVNSYNKDAVKNYMNDCAKWARLCNNIFELITYDSIINSQSIRIFEIRFLNGRMITGLPGTAVSLRSYSSRNVILDEAAYRTESLEDLLASASAQLLHGGSVRLMSTHAGIDSDFNALCEKIKKGELPYKLFKTTFKDAIKQGLYKRICLKNGEEWSIEKQKAWRLEIYAQYGIRAAEELDVIPGDYSSEGKLFNKFIYTSQKEIDLEYWNYTYARYHDLATSEDDTSFFSASVKIAFHMKTQHIVIIDWEAAHLNPLDGDAEIVRAAIADGVECTQVIEEENRSSGRKYVEIMKTRLAEMGIFRVEGYHPTISKLQRLIPVANAAQLGRVSILQEIRDREELERMLRRVSMKKVPLVSDLADCISGLYDFMINDFLSMLGS